MGTGWKAAVRRSVALAAVAAVPAALAVAAAASAAVPGSSNRSAGASPPMRITGTVHGARFTAVSAVAQRDFYGSLNLYFFPRRRGCGTIGGTDRPYVWLSVAKGRLEPGATLTSTGRIPVAANLDGTLVTQGVALTLTRIGGGSTAWRGRVRIVSPAAPARTRFTGSFVARSCGVS